MILKYIYFQLFRGHITKKLCAEVGEGRVNKRDLGKLFTLTAQIGGGGKEGVEHTKERVFIKRYTQPKE